MKQYRDIFVIGLALFAMFFGAGNLIFPPRLGMLAGDQWWMSLLGFLTTDVGLSILGIVAVAKAGGNFNQFAGKVGPKFAMVLGAAIMLIVGPLVAIPRTGAVSYEMGFLPLLPATNQWLFSAIYFGLAFYFAIDPKGVMDKIGKWLTPVLLLSLVAIIIKNIIYPTGSPVVVQQGRIFTSGFLEGYQTVDGIASVLFASIILITLKNKGYTNANEQVKMTIRSSYLAFGLIAMVYAGFFYLGSTGGSWLNHDLPRTEIFTLLVNRVFGSWGNYIVAIAVIFACFTTTAGLLATISEYFSEQSWCPIAYRPMVVILTVISFMLANLGVEQIVTFAGPILNILYPAVIVLIILSLFGQYIKTNQVYSGAIAGTLIFCTLLTLAQYGHFDTLMSWLKSMPLGKYDMGWVVPALLGGFILPVTKGDFAPVRLHK